MCVCAMVELDVVDVGVCLCHGGAGCSGYMCVCAMVELDVVDVGVFVPWWCWM